MNNEIKGILEELESMFEISELEQQVNNINKIKNHITNLQGERNDYKDSFNLMAKFRDKALVREWDYKSRIDKATQYYLSTLAQYEKEFKKMPDEAVMMFNLLEGNKNERRI